MEFTKRDLSHHLTI